MSNEEDSTACSKQQQQYNASVGDFPLPLYEPTAAVPVVPDQWNLTVKTKLLDLCTKHKKLK